MRYRNRIFSAVTILVAVFLVVGFLNPMAFSIEALRFEVSINYSEPGVTAISIPPLGAITAVTHRGPLGINLTLTSVDLDALGRLIGSVTDQKQLVQLVQAQLTETVRRYVLRLLGLAFLGGVAGGLLLRYRRWEYY
ncbi:MAG TPA: hypothetical protein GX504_11645, partial [Clostridia bacterium]|nr:hypothetical protein [Clostridia bacterium]